MPRRMPRNLIIYRLKQRFLKLNNNDDFKMDEVDWYTLDFKLEYSEALDDFERQYPQFNWRTKEEEEDCRFKIGSNGIISKKRISTFFDRLKKRE